MATMTTEATGTTLARLHELSVERTGDSSLLLFEDQRWTGRQLAGRSARLSAGLREAGVGPGDRVVVCMANCPEVGIAYQAIWRAGGAVTPVLFLLSEDELRHVLVDSEAVLVVTTPEFLPRVCAAAAGVPTVRGIVVAGPAAGDLVAGSPPLLSYADLEAAAPGGIVDRAPSDLAALLYTGGTTGRSKGVMLSNDAVSAAAWAAASNSESGARRISLLPLPMSHVYGLMVSVLALHMPDPSTSVLMRWFDPDGWIALVEEHKVDISAVVPSMFAMLLTRPLEDHDLSSLRQVVSGGAPLPREIAEEFTRRVPGVEIAEGYGCTETSALIASSPVGKARAGSVGLPAPGISVRIVRLDGEAADAGEDGEICVAGPVLMQGYWHAKDETAAVLRDGWLHTGDIGHFDADGYLYVVDRIKDLIIRGGFNVYPRDVEDALIAHPDVLACAVVGRPDPRYGEEVVAFVQLRSGATATPEDLVAFGREHLSAAKYPREVRIVGQVPLTSVGKTDRKALRSTLL